MVESAHSSTSSRGAQHNLYLSHPSPLPVDMPIYIICGCMCVCLSLCLPACRSVLPVCVTVCLSVPWSVCHFTYLHSLPSSCLHFPHYSLSHLHIYKSRSYHQVHSCIHQESRALKNPHIHQYLQGETVANLSHPSLSSLPLLTYTTFSIIMFESWFA